MGEWINKKWYINVMKYYLVKKRNDLLIYEIIQMDFKRIC